MENKTAVEIYSDEIFKILGDTVNSFTIEQTLANHYALKQALEIMEQQIIDAYMKGIECNIENGFAFEDLYAKKYYEQTFKKFNNGIKKIF